MRPSLRPTTPKLPGQPLTITLQVADTNLTGAKIVWEGLAQDPAFGGLSYTFTPASQEGPCWVEAEVQWPDGRRAFATNSVIVSTNAPPQLSVPNFRAGDSLRTGRRAAGNVRHPGLNELVQLATDQHEYIAGQWADANWRSAGRQRFRSGIIGR